MIIDFLGLEARLARKSRSAFLHLITAQRGDECRSRPPVLLHYKLVEIVKRVAQESPLFGRQRCRQIERATLRVPLQSVVDRDRKNLDRATVDQHTHQFVFLVGFLYSAPVLNVVASQHLRDQFTQSVFVLRRVEIVERSEFALQIKCLPHFSALNLNHGHICPLVVVEHATRNHLLGRKATERGFTGDFQGDVARKSGERADALVVQNVQVAKVGGHGGGQ